MLRSCRVAVLVATVVLGVIPAASAQALPFAGHYAIAHDVRWTGDQVVLTMSVELLNDSDTTALQAAVVIERPGAPDDQALTPDWILATFGPRDLAARGRMTARQQLTIPGDVWGSWQQDKPAFRVIFYDDATGEASQRVFLAETGEIELER